MRIKKIKFTAVSLLAISVIASCNTPDNINTKDVSSIAKSQINSKTQVSGSVVFPINNKLKVKASEENVNQGATVSLINISDNKTIATGLTNNLGTFTINPEPAFNPPPNSIYILEASKRNGDTLMGLRTYIKRENGIWKGITTPEIVISSKTTALFVIAGLNSGSVNPLNLIGSINSSNVFTESAGITNPVLGKVDQLVADILFQNGDPVKLITLDKGTYFAIKPADIRKSFVGDSLIYFLRGNDCCPQPYDIKVAEFNGINNPTILTWNSGYINQAFIMPDRKKILYSAVNEDTGEGSILVNDILGNPLYNLIEDLVEDGRSDNYLIPSSSKTKFMFNIIDNDNEGIYITDGTLENRLKVSDSISDGYAKSSMSWSPNDNKVLYLGTGPASDLFIANANGTGANIKIPGHLGQDIGGTEWSPDGSKLYVGKYLTYNPNTSIIYVTSINNNSASTPVNITNQPEMGDHNVWAKPIFSPNSEKIAWISMKTDFSFFAIYVANSDGSGNAVKVTGNKSFNYLDYLAWSPDSSKLIFNGTEPGEDVMSVYVSELTENSTVKVNGDIESETAQAFLSGDSDRAFFTGVDSDSGETSMYSSASDGSEDPEPFTEPGYFYFFDCIDPLGERYLYVDNYQFFSMDNQGENITLLSNIAPDEGRAKWTPDGTRVIFANSNGVYKVNADGTGLVKLTSDQPDDFDISIK